MGVHLVAFFALASFGVTVGAFALIRHDKTTPLRALPLARPLALHRLRAGGAADAEAYDIGTAPAVRFANWVTEANYDEDEELDSVASNSVDRNAGVASSGSTESTGSEATDSAGRLRSISQGLWRALASEKRLVHYTSAEQVREWCMAKDSVRSGDGRSAWRRFRNSLSTS